jgi:AAA domain
MAALQSNSRSSANKEIRSEMMVIESLKLRKEPNPHLQLNRVVRNSLTGEDVRYATADFWLEGKDMEGNPRRLWDFKLVNNDDSKPVQADAGHKKTSSLIFNYSRAVVSGVDRIPAHWPVEVKDSIGNLSVYRDDGIATISLATVTRSSGQGVLEYLRNASPGRLWKPYMGIKPWVSWESLQTLYGDEGPLEIESPVPQHEPRCHFSSLEEVLIKLSVGRYVDQKWEEKMFREQCKGGFNASFFLLGPDTAIACLRRKDPRIVIHPNALWDEKMKIILKLNVEIADPMAKRDKLENLEKTVMMKGHVVSNQTSIDCEIVVLLQWIPRQLYALLRSLKQPPNFIELSDVFIEVNDKPAQNQVESLNALFDRDEARFAKWWPALLPELPSSVAQIDFLQDLGLSPEEFQEALNEVIDRMRGAGKPLNQEQNDILSNAPFSTAGFKLIMGPPGCGKTTLIAMLADLYLRAPDVAVLVLAGSNGSTDRSFETLASWIQKGTDLERRRFPLHVHKKYVEFDHFLSVFDPTSIESRNRAAEKFALGICKGGQPPQLSFYKHQQHVEKQKHMSDADSGVSAAVTQAMQDGKLPAVPTPGNPASQRTHDAHRAHAESGLSHLMRSRKSAMQNGLRPLERAELRLAFDAVARYIIGTKRLIVSTAGNATSAILQDCIFRDAKHVIVIMDEAGLATDADLVNILARLFTTERVSTEFGGEYPIATMVLVGDHKQGGPLVKSDSAKANIFGPQLAMSPFLRLTLCGFPIDHLWEQHRMVETICKLPSIRGYDGRLRTSERVRNRFITTEQREILDFLFEPDLSELKYPSNANRTYLEDQHLCHWLIDVRGGSTQTDLALNKSRFNVANVDVTLRLLKVLIKRHFLPPGEIRILTFYNAQRQRYIDGIYALEKELDMPGGKLHGMVHTSDSFQGREATCVILDLVVSKHYGEGTLGHAGNEKKANVAFTRARDFLFVIGDTRILECVSNGDEEGRAAFIFDSMNGFLARNAATKCSSNKAPESGLAGQFEKLSISKKTNGIRAHDVD